MSHVPGVLYSAIGILTAVFIASPASAGGMLQIPVQLMDLDQQGRIEFITNSLAATGLVGDDTVRYEDLQSFVVGGDEEGSDFKGALFIFSVKIDSRAYAYRRFECSQFLAVGTLDKSYTRPIDCKPIR